MAITFEVENIMIKLLETEALWDSNDNGFIGESIVNHLGTYEKYGQIVPIVQQWFKGKGTNRTIKNKKHRPVDYVQSHVYSLEYYMPMPFHRNQNRRIFKLNTLLVAYHKHIHQILNGFRCSKELVQLQEFGVPIVVVYQNKTTLKRYALYIEIQFE